MCDTTPSQPARNPGGSPASALPAPRCIASAVSNAASLNEALADCAARALAELVPGEDVDVALVFISARYAVAKVGPGGRETLADVAPCLRAFLPGLKAVFGCTSDGVIGDGQEWEGTPAVSITLLRLPGISLKTFHIMPDDIPSLDASQDAWRKALGGVKCPDDQPPSFLLLSDSTFSERGDLERCLAGVDFAFPGCTVFGSVVSAGAGFAKGHMICSLRRDVLGASASSSLRDSGLIGLALTGNVEVDCLVSQGCRVLGPTFEVRKVGIDDHCILEMEQVGRPGSILSAFGHLRGILGYATPTEKKLIESGLHVGFALNEFEGVVDEKNTLVRQVINVDEDKGGITLGCHVRVGQRLRFVVVDDSAARDLLDAALQRFKRSELAKSLVGYSNPPFGALMFIDADRGRKLFLERNFESRELKNYVPGVPLSGFFGRAQIGPAASTAGSTPEERDAVTVLHNRASIVAFIRNRSALAPVDPPTTPIADENID